MAGDGLSNVIASLLGGTGVANASTITLGGALLTANTFTTSGNFPLTLTVTGSTNITLPTSGTLGTGTIGGSTGGTDKALLSANGTGGSTLQATSLLFNANSQLVLQAGTSSLPAICITGSLSTGFYSDTANQIKVAANGSQIATFGAGGIQTFGSVGFVSAGILNSQGGRVVAVRTVAGNITGTSADYILAVSSTASARTVTVPNSVNTNQVFIIKDTSGNALVNNITVTTPGGTKTFDGATSLTIALNYGVIRLYYDGSNYWTW